MKKPIYTDYHSKVLDTYSIREAEQHMDIEHSVYKQKMTDWWNTLTKDEKAIEQIKDDNNLSFNVRDYTKEKQDIQLMLTNGQNKVELSDITIGKNFQFAGDRNRVRKVLYIDGENVLVKTCGCLSDKEYYFVHYSWLQENQSRLSYLQN
jgi:hypothetical protein